MTDDRAPRRNFGADDPGRRGNGGAGRRDGGYQGGDQRDDRRGGPRDGRNGQRDDRRDDRRGYGSRADSRDGDRRGQYRGDDDRRRDARGHQRSESRLRGDSQRSEAAPAARAKGTDLARSTAFDVLRQVADSDAYANLVLPPMLRSRKLTGRDAAFATELTYGTLRLRGRYDAIIAQATDRPLDQIDANVLDVLRLGAHQILTMRVPQHAAVSETVGLARERTGIGSAQFVNAILRRITERTPDEWRELITAEEPDENARLAVWHSHPAWVVRAMREALAVAGRPTSELESLLEADNTAPKVTLVARPGLVEPDGLVPGHGHARMDPGQWAPTALVLGKGDPAWFPAIREARAGVQDEGSQLVTLAFAAAPVNGADARWLDMCAGPGGKAALLGALAAERGARIVANESQPHRTELVRQSLAAVPAEAIEDVRTGDGRLIGEDEPASYDRVLVDAPCTGLGALRRRPESRWRRTPADLATLAALQRELLASALDAVRPGGVVGYVTCSPHMAETAVVVADVLKTRDAEILDAVPVVRSVLRPGAPDLDMSGPHVQLWPHIHGTDAMHLTLLRRRS